MNANVVGGVGGEDEGSLPQTMMPQTLNETVYLGRASFRITHEMETVPVEEPPVDSSTWFSRDSAVILRGSPNMVDRLAALPADELDEELPRQGLWRRVRLSWLMVAVPGAFALGILVATLTGSSAPSMSRHGLEAARTVVPPAIPPSSIAATTERIAAPPVVPSVAPSVPVSPPTVVTAPAAMTPPAPVAMTSPAAPSAADRTSSPHAPVVPRQGRPAKRHDARGVKIDRPTSAAVAGDDAPTDDEAPRAVATKASAAKWVDPWAN